MTVVPNMTSCAQGRALILFLGLVLTGEEDDGARAGGGGGGDPLVHPSSAVSLVRLRVRAYVCVRALALWCVVQPEGVMGHVMGQGRDGSRV